MSFDAAKVGSAYSRIKTLNKSKGVKFSPKNLEYFLFVFKQLQMYPEIIDVCENFQELSGSAAPSEISQYYLVSTLLNMPAKQHYFDLVKEAVFDGQEQLSAGYITAMTKAHLKDGAIEHSFKYFENQIGKLRELKTKREDFLVTLFDSVYGESDSKMSFNDYRDRYIDTFQVSENLIKESFAVNLLNRVIKDKNYNEIDSLFQLYIVQKHENTLLAKIPTDLVDSNLS